MNDFVDPAYRNYQSRRRESWDKTAMDMKSWKGFGGYYHRRLQTIYRRVIPPGYRVLELGCGYGDLLSAVKPSFGLGVDFSLPMLKEARKKHSSLQFVQADAHEVVFKGTPFDFIILSDVLNDAWDVQKIFQNIMVMATPSTRIIINTYSRLWEFPLWISQKLHLARPVLYQNWLTISDINNLLNVAGLDTISTWREIMFPFYIPGVTSFFNRFLVKFPLFDQLGLGNFILARPLGLIKKLPHHPSVSIIVPARNEAGNIEVLFKTLPAFCKKMELIFVEGHSTDNTAKTIKKCMASHSDVLCKLIPQSGEGKGDAVRSGFDQAEGDILMILDADLTVPPDCLPRFYEALVQGRGELINGVRLVYPMERQAMRFFNLLGNKFFSLVFSWILSQPVKDTLCGTKVLWKKDYLRIARGRGYFGEFDPFGDFDLLFGAARLGLKIVDMPIRYRERVYGATNIQRWTHGFLLLRMAAFAARRLKFT